MAKPAATLANQPIIELRELTKNYLTKTTYSWFSRLIHPRSSLYRTAQTPAVKSLNLDIYKGEIMAVMGFSGCGKSTLLKMINWLIKPSSGSIRIDGQEIGNLSKQQLVDLRRTKMSMVFQSFGLMPHLTVAENIAFGLDIAGVARPVQQIRVESLLESVGLEGYANHMPSQLSGGMQQRVGLARALAPNPQILLMDEPFSALDPLTRYEMQDLLLKLQAQEDRTIVFITHDPEEAIRIGDRIAIMEAGELVQLGTSEEIIGAPATPYVEDFFKSVDLTENSA